jgi:hypothetical protein
MKELFKFCINVGKVIIINRDQNINGVYGLCESYYGVSLKNEIEKKKM